MSRLDDIARDLRALDNPPVHLWNPENKGEIDIQIDAQGLWFHEGRAIERHRLVALFAKILWYKDNQYFLVTPVEKLTIKVADVPFLIHQMEHIENHWVGVTNTEERVIISDKNPVKLRRYQGQWLPYVNIRYGLWARVSRSIYYQWADQALAQQMTESDPLILLSGDYEFEVARI